jgi:hypothetical protein
MVQLLGYPLISHLSLSNEFEMVRVLNQRILT